MKGLRGWRLNQRDKCGVKIEKEAETFGMKPFWHHRVRREMKQEFVTQTDKGKRSKSHFSSENVCQDGRSNLRFAGASSVFS